MYIAIDEAKNIALIKRGLTGDAKGSGGDASFNQAKLCYLLAF
jgi:hypothetical protein